MIVPGLLEPDWRGHEAFVDGEDNWQGSADFAGRGKVSHPIFSSSYGGFVVDAISLGSAAAVSFALDDAVGIVDADGFFDILKQLIF